jgi:hypothetical protein
VRRGVPVHGSMTAGEQSPAACPSIALSLWLKIHFFVGCLARTVGQATIMSEFVSSRFKSKLAVLLPA